MLENLLHVINFFVAVFLVILVSASVTTAICVSLNFLSKIESANDSDNIKKP